MTWHVTDAQRVAKKLVSNARRNGSLPRPTACEVCGLRCERIKPRPTHSFVTVIWHHWDYSKPLDLIPLCRACHGKVHSGEIPEPRTGRVYSIAS